ncbi:MAG: hypothetical protein OEM15_03745 [Myxococcales bacterium]|nr:hypothetical protein [Myxococcales bacterium]MDH3483823.1 hypothetical protein [Myxococcales bacterium]
MGQLQELLSEDTPDIAAVEAYLDSLDSKQRISEIRTLARRHQARLFEAARGHKPISLDDIVDPTRPPMEEVVHYGKNSLPAFSHFAKVFVRPDAAMSKELWGYNRSGGFVETVVGPGYFVAYPYEVEGEVLVDYLRVPPGRPTEWPEILPNSSRLSAFVYNGTRDVLRGVSKHVNIGRAFKGGKPMSAWFVLCRSDDS